MKSEPFYPACGRSGSTTTIPAQYTRTVQVAYVIEAEPRIFIQNAENTPMNISHVERRVVNGLCFHRPLSGCRDLHCHSGPLFPRTTVDVSVERFDVVRHYCESRLFQAALLSPSVSHGIMRVSPEAVLNIEKQREEMLACSYKR
jgi:hypothetical protein